VVVLAIVAAAFALVLPGHARAQQGKVIELTYGTPYGPDHTFSKSDKRWFAKIEKETNGRVKFKPYWGGSVISGGAEAIDEMVAGVADVGFISPGQARSGYDLTKINFLLFTGANVNNGYRIFMQVLKDNPEIEKEYKGLKVMGWSSGTEYQLFTRKPVRRLSDAKGMRVKTLGEIVAVLKDLGIEGVNTPASEFYLSLQKGQLDGGFFPISPLMTLRYSEVAKYVTLLHLYRPHTGSRVMCLKTWNKLPPDIQKVFENNVGWFSVESDKDCMKDDDDAREFGKKAGVEFIDLPKEDMTRFYDLVRQEGAKQAKLVDAKGLPGTKILNDAQRLRKASQK